MSRALDLAFMREALALARSQLGRTAPNPSVGCVIAAGGVAIGRGATADGGRPHAERLALDAAGPAARGADVFVTLEPCAHHGVTPPCAEALVEAGPARVVIACSDPDPRVAGKGADLLRRAGVKVETGLEQAAAEALNAGFFKRLATGMPWVAIAETGDGFDAELDVSASLDLRAELVRLGDAGLTRVWARAGTKLAEALNVLKLVDETGERPGTRR